MKVAIRRAGDRGANDRLDQYIAAHPQFTFETFEPKDDDDLNQQLCAGAFTKVVYADLDSLLESLWKGHADFPKWETARVEIEFCNPSVGEWRAMLAQVHRSLERWRAIQRKRQVIAATILSAIILAAIAVLLGLLGPAK